MGPGAGLGWAGLGWAGLGDAVMLLPRDKVDRNR